MPRPRAFDTDTFLDRALDVFWQRGYAATSMADIYEATGLGAGSVYAFVKDKTELFQRVFERYGGMFAATLPTNVAGREALERWFGFLTNYLADDPERKGCLICNTIIERAAHAPETLTLADARVAEVRAWFVEQLRAAAGSRDLRKDLDPEVVADSLVATTLGMMALARARTDRGALKTIADAALAGLWQPKATTAAGVPA